MSFFMGINASVQWAISTAEERCSVTITYSATMTPFHMRKNSLFKKRERKYYQNTESKS